MIESNLHDSKYLVLTGEVVNVANACRLVALAIIDNKIYLSDCDHKECIWNYCKESNRDLDICWSNPDKGIESNYAQLFHDTSNDFYSFSIYDWEEGKYLLAAHFPLHLEKNFHMIKKYAEENDCILGTFFNLEYSNCDVKIIDIEATERVMGEKNGKYLTFRVQCNHVL